MTAEPITPYRRLVTALQGGTPDRVPVFLPITMHGAKELGQTLQDYFAKGEHVAEGQLRLQQKYGYDGLFLTFYAVAEAIPFGAEAIFFDDGPPNLGTPPLRDWQRIPQLAVPDPLDSPPLRETLRAIELCAARVKGTVPIVGLAVPPFSLPALLLGLENWLELLLFGPPTLRDALLRVTAEFCVRWANMQLAAGADAIVLPDAVSSRTIITRQQFIAWALPVLRETIPRIKGPVVLAGVGRVQGIADLLPQTGALAALVTAEDDLLQCKRAFGGHLALIGNLNNIAMVGWDYAEAQREATAALRQAAPGGGYVLAPQWELPFAVADDALAGLVDAAWSWGRYPFQEQEQ